MDDALRIAAHDILRASGHDYLGAGHPRGADAVDDDAETLEVLIHDLYGVDQGRQHHDGRAMLVVVEDRDVEILLQPLFDLEASRGRDILQVYAAESRGQILDGLYY